MGLIGKAISIFGLYIVYMATFYQKTQLFGEILWGPMLIGIVIASIGAGIAGHAEEAQQKQRDKEARSIVEKLVQAENVPYEIALYLRPFDLDGQILRDQSRENYFSLEQYLRPGDDPFERALNDALAYRFKFIGLGIPNTNIAGVGRAGAYDNWREQVNMLLEIATLVVMVPSASQAVLWEIEQIANNEHTLDKTLFIMPPIHHSSLLGDAESFCESWEEVRTAVYEKCELTLPEYQAHGAFIKYWKSPKTEPTMVGVNSVSVTKLRKQLNKIGVNCFQTASELRAEAGKT